MTLFLVSVLLSAAGALVSILAHKQEGVAKVLGCTFGVAAALFALAGGLQGLIGEVLTFSIPTPFFALSLRIDPLAGVLISVISVLALAAWLYGYSYFDAYRGKGIGGICFFMNLFIGSMDMVIASDNVFWFLVFFEMMSLTSYFLVVTEQDKAAIKGGFMYLVMAHIGFFMIMVAFFIMSATTGSFEFSSFRETSFSPVAASLIFMLAFFGFGTKAGMIPFHSWLPQAHPAAPSNVSALMSGGMIKIGIFGIIKVAFDLLNCSGCQMWWGIVVVLFGAISSVLGVTYALAEHDTKRLLAYHSVENIGIILMGVGVALIGWASGSPVLTVIGLLAAIFHLINHAMFKGALFLGAGSVLYATDTRNMEILGGLGRLMPVTSICFLIGALAISAIPPLNGFVSEWLTYQGLITAAFSGGAVVKIVCAAVVVSLALTGALAVTCFVKVYSVTFLGKARSKAAENAKEVPGPMKLAMILLALICVVLGVCSPWVVPTLTNAAAATAGQSVVAMASGISVVNPVLSSTMSTPLVAVLLVATIGLPFIIIKAKSRGGRRDTPDPWACGYNPTPDMPLVGSSFSSSIRMFYGPLYRMRDGLVAMAPAFQSFLAGLSRWADKAQNWGDDILVEPTARFVRWLSGLSSKVEGGDYRVYIIYTVVALVIFLILAVTVR